MSDETLDSGKVKAKMDFAWQSPPPQQAFCEAGDGFLADVIDRATRDGWTIDDASVQKVRLAMQDLVDIKKVSTKSKQDYEWCIKNDGASDSLFPHSPNSLERDLARRLCFAANEFLQAVERTLANQVPSREPSHAQATPTPLWKRACAETRFLLREDRQVSVRSDVYEVPKAPAGVTPTLGQPKPDVVIVAKDVFDRVHRGGSEAALTQQTAETASRPQAEPREECEASQCWAIDEISSKLFWDEVIVLETKSSKQPEDLLHATSSCMLKTSLIKAYTLSNGDMWFAILTSSLLYFGWMNAGITIRHGPVDATKDPNLFLRALLMLASKGLTLALSEPEVAANSHDDTPSQLATLSLAPHEVTGDSESARAALRAQQISRAEPLRLRMRPLLKKGAQIRFRLVDTTSVASSAQIGDLAVVELDADVTSADIRCSGWSRGLQHRPVGKHTDVYVVICRLITPTIQLNPGRHALKTSSCRGRHMGREIRHLDQLRGLFEDRPSVQKRLPEVLAFGRLAISETDPVASLLHDAQQQHGASDATTSPAARVTAEALGSTRTLLMTLYKDETFELQSLELRHSMAVVSDAVLMFAHCWYKGRFVHRDVSASNIAARLSRQQLEEHDGQIREVLQKRLVMLESVTTRSDQPWTEAWAQDPSDAACLCVVLDPENATFFGKDEAGEREEKEANFSGTPLYQAHLNFHNRYYSVWNTPHYTAEDVESLLPVCLDLLSADKQGREHNDDELRGFKAFDVAEVERLAGFTPAQLRARVSEPDLLGANHWATARLGAWRGLHRAFSRAREEFTDNYCGPPQNLREDMCASPKLSRELDKLLLGAAKQATLLALAAYEEWQAETGEQP